MARIQTSMLAKNARRKLLVSAPLDLAGAAGTGVFLFNVPANTRFVISAMTAVVTTAVAADMTAPVIDIGSLSDDDDLVAAHAFADADAVGLEDALTLLTATHAPRKEYAGKPVVAGGTAIYATIKTQAADSGSAAGVVQIQVEYWELDDEGWE